MLIWLESYITYFFSTKKWFFETYIRYELYCKDILYNFLTQRKICLKHIPDITYTLKIYDDNGNEMYGPPSNQGKAHTDTDSDGKTEIITDITCKFKGKLIAMEVKVDPGSETNCIPLSHLRHLFPQLCSKDVNPKENALEPTLAWFEAYDGGILHSHGWIILPTQDIRDSKKFHPVRYYVVTREEARILISHATATWLGLVKVLCQNKSSKIKRQVASVSKKAKEPPNQLNNNFTSGPQHPPKVKYTISTPQHPPKVKYMWCNRDRRNASCYKNKWLQCLPCGGGRLHKYKSIKPSSYQ